MLTWLGSEGLTFRTCNSKSRFNNPLKAAQNLEVSNPDGVLGSVRDCGLRELEKFTRVHFG